MPKARLVGLAESDPGATPVPESGMLKFGFDPFDVMLTLPLAEPLADGAKSTEKDVLWPGLSVTGTVRPLRLNPLPLAEAAEIVRLVPPEFVSVPESDFEPPTTTLPKLKLVGFEVTCPWVTPVPERGTESVGLPALELIVSVPVAAPALAGANLTLNVVDCPPARVVGNDGPVKLNPLPEADALEMVTLAPPVFETLTAVVWLFPTVTFPKFTLLGLAVRDPDARPVPERLMFRGEFASEVMARFPLTAPAAVGAKTTLKVTL